MKNFWHFIQYHNAVPLAVTFLVMGAGVTFAATDPQAIYSQQQKTITEDNTYIANKDLSTYTPQVQIESVTEDADTYYVAYSFKTIDSQDSVWQDVVKHNTMNVDKSVLGQYGDLGLYVMAQLKQNIDHEIDRLKEVQTIARANLTQKIVATAYGGLIGQMLNDSTETLPGYTPVVTPQVSDQVAAAGATQTSSQSGNSSLRIQLLGNNPAQIPFHATYVDLGAIVTDAANDNLGIHTFLNGKEVTQIQIDTSTTSVSTIRYVSADPQGNSTSIERKVYVYDPAVGQPFPDPVSVEPAPVPTPVVLTTAPSAATSTPDTATTTPPEITTPAATSTDSAPSTISPQAPDSATTTPPVATTPPDAATSTDATSSSATVTSTSTTP